MLYEDATRVTNTYDALSQRLTMQDSTGTTTFTYDAVRRLNTVKYPANKTITYSYDEVGNRSVMVDPDSGRTTYSYDAVNNLTSLLNPFSERTTFVYDALNRAVTVTHGNQTKAEHDYNAAGWLTALRNLKSDNSVISIFTYTYDNAANRLSMSEANGDRVTWTYDALYQLTRERRSGANSFDITYTYDPVGNRLTKLQSGTTTTYTYDSANELTTEQAGATVTTYSYDNNGNTPLKNAAGQRELAEFDTTYTWDKENRMTKLEQPTSPTLMTFTYDGNSYRRSLHDGTSLTKFLNDWVTGTPGIDPVLIETDGNDSTIVTYTPALLHGLLSLTRHPSLVTHWYHYEGVGSTRQLTDSNQAITDEYLYEAFGKEVVTTGTTVNALRFVGRLNYNTDGKSGLVLLGVMWYAPSLGEFVNRHSNMMELNRHAYATNSPVNSVDLTGASSRMLRRPLGRGISSGSVKVIPIPNPSFGEIISSSVPTEPTVKKGQPCKGKGLTPGEFLCAYKYYWKWKKSDKYDRWVHCMAACDIAKDCGKTAAVEAGLLKEDFDAWLKKIGLGEGWDYLDIEADNAGVYCADSTYTCDDCCAQQGYHPDGPLFFSPPVPPPVNYCYLPITMGLCKLVACGTPGAKLGKCPEA